MITYSENHFETVFCGQGELFAIPDLRELTVAYLQNVKAGREYVNANIPDTTRKALFALLLFKEDFESMADGSWQICNGLRLLGLLTQRTPLSYGIPSALGARDFLDVKIRTTMVTI